ncbi:MAG: hypothetical protein AB1Y26_06050 [Cycloclasticus sp.]
MLSNTNTPPNILDPLVDIFKLSGEPFEYLSESDVHLALTQNPTEYYQFVKQRVTNLAIQKSKFIMPPKTLFPDKDTDGDFRIMPCIIEENDEVMKTVKLVGTNVIQQSVPNQITVGKACVLHPTENYITHIVEACLLSSARTAICAMLGVELLSARDASKLTIIGAGRVGYYCAYYASALSWFNEIIIHDTDSSRAQSCVKTLQSLFPKIKYITSKRQDLIDTDVLILSTTSTAPLYATHDFKADLIISVGADIDTQRELDNSWAKAASVFVDSYDSARYGDIKVWLDNNLITSTCLTDLFSLLRSEVSITYNKPRIFVSTGTAFFDNLSLSYILRKV